MAALLELQGAPQLSDLSSQPQFAPEQTIWAGNESPRPAGYTRLKIAVLTWYRKRIHDDENNLRTFASPGKIVSFILSRPTLNNHLFLTCIKLQLQMTHNPGTQEHGNGAAEDNQRLAQARHQRIVVGDDQLAVPEVVHQVARLNDEGRAANRVEEGLVDLDVGRGDGLIRD